MNDAFVGECSDRRGFEVRSSDDRIAPNHIRTDAASLLAFPTKKNPRTLVVKFHPMHTGLKL